MVRIALLALVLVGSLAAQGVIVIRPKKRPEPAAQPSGGATSEGGSPSEGAAPPPEAEKPKNQSRSRRQFEYDSSGRRVQSNTASSSSTRAAGGGASSSSLRNVNGLNVEYLSSNEEVTSKTSKSKTSEKVTKRYDLSGRALGDARVKKVERTLPDGTVETTTTYFEEDFNGTLRQTERRVMREKESASGSRTTETVEKASINGGWRVTEREESQEKKRGDTHAEITRSKKVDDGSGRLVEFEREQTVMTKKGQVESTDSTVWRKNQLTGALEFNRRTLGEKQNRANGSSVEKVQVFGLMTEDGVTYSGGSSKPQLLSVVDKRTNKAADGTTKEVATVQKRTAANSGTLRTTQRVETTTRPVGEGEDEVTTSVFEAGVNGRMRQTAQTVETVKTDPE